MACLDTTVLIDLRRRRGGGVGRRAHRKIAELQTAGEALVTTRFNVAELWVGIERSKHPEREERAVEELLASLIVLEFDQAAAQMFGRLMTRLQLVGRPAGDMDVLIASVALVNGQSLVTRDAKHFADVPGLVVESY